MIGGGNIFLKGGSHPPLVQIRQNELHQLNFAQFQNHPEEIYYTSIQFLRFYGIMSYIQWHIQTLKQRKLCLSSKHIDFIALNLHQSHSPIFFYYFFVQNIFFYCMLLPRNNRYANLMIKLAWSQPISETERPIKPILTAFVLDNF